MFTAPTDCTSGVIQECTFGLPSTESTSFPLTVDITAYGVENKTQTMDQLLTVEAALGEPRFTGCYKREKSNPDVEFFCTLVNYTRDSTIFPINVTLVDTGNPANTFQAS